MHLLGLFKRKAKEERRLDIVDKYNDDMQTHRAEVVERMRVAVWCLQSDFSRRPSMSVIVKVLEGSVDVQSNLDYSFRTPVAPRAITVAEYSMAKLSTTKIKFLECTFDSLTKSSRSILIISKGNFGKDDMGQSLKGLF
ncbi:G-type lectin S-receptor-like serine/threonine-protein kinase SD2-5 [Camellia lanceoleosa]|uniref:G-type lectin S-receptor-like serine/threonine-protein kinase SD2-5 n=1 Tax=Camellia lanceoleosa TaxID=1840588 RepID=A0ACC0H5K8_9ERIC|nr:G-type lectin S-receptor-like serine/threonine-protein kinase SD2-5 [Camellia lanceoleosa]